MALSLRFIDCLAVALSALAAYGIKDYYGDLTLINEGNAYYVMVLLAGVMLVMGGGDIYRSWRESSSIAILRGVTSRWISISVILLMVLFSSKASEEISRVWFFLWVFLGLLSLLISRLVFYFAVRELRRLGGNARRVVVMGSGDLAGRMIQKVRESSWSGYVILEHIQRLDEASFSALEDKQMDEIWLAIPLADQAEIRKIMAKLSYLPSTVRYIPDLFALGLINHGLSEVLGIPMVDLTASRMDGLSKLLKGLEDYTVASIALILFSPLMVLIGVLIKLESKGPVFFRQKRHGLSGKVIKVFKFRTMKVEQKQTDTVVQAKKNDDRVTRVGKILRRTSLDELPQLFNVIRGEMSIVGPRPHAVEHNNQYKTLIDSYMKRHIVKPGITGWAQINGFRGGTDTLEKMEGRVQCDIYYIENWSILLDLRIMALTLIKGMVGENAY